MSLFYKRITYLNNLRKLCDIQRSNLFNNAVVYRKYSTKVPKDKKGIFKLGMVGVTIGAVVGTGYSIHHLNKPRIHISNEELTIPIVKEVPEVTPSRKIKIASDQTGLKLTLYQYQTCPFCCKVRAFLDYYGVSYNVVEVDPVLRQSIKWSPYKKVPILVANVENGYQPLNDSSMIISALSSYIHNNNQVLTEIVQCYPLISYFDDNGSTKQDIMNKYFIMFHGKDLRETAKEELSDERKWRKWVDDVFVHTLSPNVYRTPEEALQAFKWFSDTGDWEKHFPAWERYLMIYVGASAMWLIGKRLKKRHNLKEDVRQSLYDECNNWMKAINDKGTEFMGGKEPNLADLAVYGVLNSIEGCSAFSDLLNNTKIKRWYLEMKNAVMNHQGSAFA